MGVTVKFTDLSPDSYCGTTFSEHAKLAAWFEGKIVAIDGAQWILQACQADRLKEVMQQGNARSSESGRQSVLTLFADRITQMLRYGSHPVVILDGRVPGGKKDVYAGYERSTSEYCMLVKDLCDFMAVPSIAAPSEGEAFLAALDNLGKVDLIWTHDVVDAFMFGARNVLRPLQDGKVNQTVLCFKTPAKSVAAVLSRSGMAQYLGCKEEQVADVVTCFGALVGTDFNDGLQTYGPIKARGMIDWLHKAWQQHDVCFSFDEFVEAVISRGVDVVAKEKKYQTFLSLARHEGNMNAEAVPFIDQLRAVFRIVRDQRRQAERQAANFSREQLMWDGGKVRHARLVSLLEKDHAPKDASKDKIPPVLRVMNLEAERMLRSTEDNCKACTRIVSISKTKEFGKEENEDAEVLDTDDVGESQCFQYLVNIEFNKEGFPGFSSSGGLGAVLERLQKYFDETKGKKTGTWVSGARIARKSALVENWPSVLQGWKDKKAGKKQAADVKSQKAAGKAQKAAEKKAQQAQQGCLGSLSDKDTAPCGSKRITAMFPTHKPATAAEKHGAEPAQVQNTQQRERKNGAGTSMGLQGGATIKTIPTPPRRPRKNIFTSLITPKRNDSPSPSGAPPSSHPLSPPQSHSLDPPSDSAGSPCVTPRKKPARAFHECDAVKALDSIDLTSPLKKRAVSPDVSQGAASPVNSSPGCSGAIDLIDSPTPKALQPVKLNQASAPKAKRCVDLTCDSDSD